jgi:Flp pilus assembly pilin Flp
MKKSLKNQIGWTTMEYIVGALLIISIVTAVVGMVQDGLNKKAEAVKNALGN